MDSTLCQCHSRRGQKRQQSYASSNPTMIPHEDVPFLEVDFVLRGLIDRDFLNSSIEQVETDETIRDIGVGQADAKIWDGGIGRVVPA